MGELVFRILIFLIALYAFFVSIDLMSASFKLSGKAFAQGLLETVSDPVAGMILGLLATTLIQSSSTTTSMVVGLVAAGTLPLRLAIPVVMGANIGTTVTNTLVSVGMVFRRGEFKRAFAASTVHDYFNVLAVIVLLPIEIFFHPIETCATALEKIFEGVGGIQMVSPLKTVVKPATHALTDAVPVAWILFLISLALLFLSLSQMVRAMRKLVLTRVEGLFDRVLFRNDLAGFVLGWILTAVIQSSSATTSLIVPLAGTGVLSLKKVFPYTLGANLGTTVTAILASFATGNPVAITVALSHLVFNVMGMALFYPARALPIWLAARTGEIAARSRKHMITVITIYVVLHAVPILYLVLR
jgi:sodium-dependent phosphate cotransporter